MYFAVGTTDTLSKWGGIITLAGLLVVGFVYLYSTAKRGRQDILRQDNADLRASNSELRNEKTGHEATIDQQKEAIHNLRDIATQTPAVTKLIEMNTKQHREVVQALTNLTGQLSNLVIEFSTLSKSINDERKSRNGTN